VDVAAEKPKHRTIETSKRQNVKTSKRQNVKTSRLRSDEAATPHLVTFSPFSALGLFASTSPITASPLRLHVPPNRPTAACPA
jgi:hypothetical protein